MKKKIAVFDLDGTLTYFDTLMVFIIVTNGFWKTFFKSIKHIPFYIKYFSGRLSKQSFKEFLLMNHLGGKTREFFKTEGAAFFQNNKWLFRKKVVDSLLRDKKEGMEVIIVTANIEPLVENLKAILPIDLIIATKLEFINDRLTGKIFGKNCWGEEKLRRLLEVLDRSAVEMIAYGDSRGDLEMLQNADVAHWI